MPYQIKIDSSPKGYSLTFGKPGEVINVSCREFITFEDGELFFSRLEGWPSIILSKLPMSIKASTIDHMLVIFNPDNTADVFINELTITGRALFRRSKRKGEAFFCNDILDVERLTINNVTIPPESSFMIILSSGWRKGFYYDFFPSLNNKPREYDLEVVLGQIWSYLLFQNMFTIDENTWRILKQQRWFPFIMLGSNLIRKMILYAKDNQQVDDLIPEFEGEMQTLLDKNFGIFENHQYFNDHIEAIKTARERYLEKDFISTVSILFPRIEGIMRSYWVDINPGIGPGSTKLIDEIIRKSELNQRTYCSFLPQKFYSYMNDVYFEHFIPGTKPTVSRHSVGHGEALITDFNTKSSMIAFLILFQIAFFIPSKSNP